MMKWLCFLLLPASAAHAQERPLSQDGETYKELGRIMEMVKSRSRDMERVTPKAVYIDGPFSGACGPGVSAAQMAAAGPHARRYIHVYVTPAAKQTLLQGKGVYAVGTLIVKEKLEHPDAKEPELFTAMIKRTAGYNPGAGDWEFLVLDDSHRVITHGKLDSCIHCHRLYSESDCVSRRYLLEPANNGRSQR